MILSCNPDFNFKRSFQHTIPGVSSSVFVIELALSLKKLSTFIKIRVKSICSQNVVGFSRLRTWNTKYIKNNSPKFEFQLISFAF